MTDGSFQTLGERITGMIRSPDPRPLLDFISFPFSFIENDFTLFIKDEKDLFELHDILAPAVRQVSSYDISDSSVIPIGSALYLANFSVEVGFINGHRQDRAKRVVILAERDGETKAISGMSLIQCSTAWLAEQDPDAFEKVQKWAS